MGDARGTGLARGEGEGEGDRMRRLLGGLCIDAFAGGGGASTGIEMALGLSPDYAVNHDAEALRLHESNHPDTVHYLSDILRVDPVALTRGRPVGLLWASPDCKHHSRAKGGKPREQAIRDLAWVVSRWARTMRPTVVVIENVIEFEDWSPLDAEGRPNPRLRGQTFAAFVASLERQGYRVDYRVISACDLGAPTTRRRLYLVARRDGRRILWPEATHARTAGEGLARWRPASDVIDWSVPCPSALMTAREAERHRKTTGVAVKRPLSANTLARVARGILRHVVEAAEPVAVDTRRGVIVSLAHGDSGGRREYGLDEPIPTQTASNTHALATPVMVAYYGTGTGSTDRSSGIDEPVRTVTTENRHALLVPYLVPRYGERPATATAPAQEPRTASVSEPIGAIVPDGNTGSLAAASVVGADRGLTSAQLRSARRVARMMRAHGCWDGGDLVVAHGHVVVDVGLRLLTARELARAQGFPDDYVLDPAHEGRPLSVTAQKRMIGNSVVPAVAAAIVRANVVRAAEGPPHAGGYRPWGAELWSEITAGRGRGRGGRPPAAARPASA